MKLKNSYIVLHREASPITKNIMDEKSDQALNSALKPPATNTEYEIVVETEDSFLSRVNRLFSKAEIIDSGNDVYTNAFQRHYKRTIEIDNNGKNELVDVYINIHVVRDKYYLSIIVEGNNVQTLVKALETTDEFLCNNIIDSKYIVIISYDAISEFYCNLAFPSLNEVERKLRNLILNIYVERLGAEYYKEVISSEFVNKNIKRMKVDNEPLEEKEKRIIQEFFYNIELGETINALFTQRWTTLDEEEYKKGNIPNQKRSDWERYFSNFSIGDQVNSLIVSFKLYRNEIAHCKFHRKKDYDEYINIANELNNVLDKAIEESESKDFVSRNVENIQQSLMKIKEEFDRIIKSITSKIKNQKYDGITDSISDAATEIRDTMTKTVIHYLHSIAYNTRDNNDTDRSKND